MPTAEEYIKYKEYYTKVNKIAKQNNAQYFKDHYENNKAKYRKAVLKHHQLKWEFIKKYKESKPCKDCEGWFESCQMDFDHLENKEFNIGRLVCGNRLKLLKEIAKCELVCSNCHRLRTKRRKDALT